MERLFRARVRDGDLEPFDRPAWQESLRTWPHSIVWVRLEDEERVHTRQQEKFWHGVIVPLVEECWMREMGWAARPAKGVVHGKLVELCFGTTPTPEGPERRSSSGFTLAEYRELIDWTGEYLWTKYEVRIPEPNEVPA